MRTTSTNVVLLGMSLIDIVSMGLRAYANFKLIFQSELDICSIYEPASYFTMIIIQIKTIAIDFSRRESTYLSLSLVSIRAFAISQIMNPKFDFLKKPKTGWITILANSIVCGLLCIPQMLSYTIETHPLVPTEECRSRYPENYTNVEYYYVSTPWMIFGIFSMQTMLDAVLAKHVPVVLFIVMTFILVRAIRNASKSRGKDDGDKTSKLVLFTTVSVIFAELPVGILYVFRSFSEDYIGWIDELKHLNCTGFINDPNSMNAYIKTGRLKLNRRYPLNLSMDCENIVQRVFDGRSFKKSLKRPIAFIRNVFTGYAFQEMLLSSDYHPDNTYCYTVDKYSTTGIFENLQILSKCLPNVIVNPTRYYFNSRGRFQSRAQFKCLQLSMRRTWSHALFLQNHDLVLKPPDHLSELSELLNDTSAMFFEEPHEGWYPKDADWTPAGLKLFKSDSEVAQDVLHKPLRIWKGFNEIIVSRLFIESIFDKLDLEGIMNLFDQRKFYGVDEMLLQTLYRNNLGLDGQPTSNCNNFVPDTIIRWTDWTNRGTSGTFYEFCKSKLERHWICIMGVEYLKDIMNTSFVIGNKILENYDVGPVLCLRELFQKNEIKKKISGLELENYPQFREMEMKQNGSYENDSFQCDN